MPEETNTDIQQIDVDSVAEAANGEEVTIASLENEEEPEKAEVTEETKEEGKPEAEAEPEKPAFDATLLDDDGEDKGDDTPIIKTPEAIAAKLTAEENAELQSQFDRATKPINQNREFRELAGTDNPEDVKTAITYGKNWVMLAHAIKTPETQKDSVIDLLSQVEAITGKGIAEIVPELMGYEVDASELEATRLQKENQELRSRYDTEQAESKWVAGSQAVIDAFEARSDGFRADAKLMAPFILKGMTPKEAIRASQPAAWEKHLFNVGLKEGAKALKRESVADTPGSNKSGQSDPELHTEGLFYGQPKLKPIKIDA